MQKTFTYTKFDFVRPPELERGQAGHYPVVVVGAGPVGLSAAIDLAQQGQRVVLLDNDDTVSIGSRAVCAKRALEIWTAWAAAIAWSTRACPGTWAAPSCTRARCSASTCCPSQPPPPGMINLQQYYLEPTWSSARASCPT
jgi:3-(3-hydroxy-phenyl)propionate hydroxylase